MRYASAFAVLRTTQRAQQSTGSTLRAAQERVEETKRFAAPPRCPAAAAPLPLPLPLRAAMAANTPRRTRSALQATQAAVTQATHTVTDAQAREELQQAALARAQQQAAAARRALGKAMKPAEQALGKLRSAVKVLTPGALQELLRDMVFPGGPPPSLLRVCEAVLLLLCRLDAGAHIAAGSGAKAGATLRPAKEVWQLARDLGAAAEETAAEMGAVGDAVLGARIPAANVAAAAQLAGTEEFKRAQSECRAVAAGALAQWVRAVVRYFEVCVAAQPAREEAARARERSQAEAAEAQQAGAQRAAAERLLAGAARDRDGRAEALRDAWQRWTALQGRVAYTQQLLARLAPLLPQWRESMQALQEQGRHVHADAAFAAAFVVYAGALRAACAAAGVLATLRALTAALQRRWARRRACALFVIAWCRWQTTRRCCPRTPTARCTRCVRRCSARSGVSGGLAGVIALPAALPPWRTPPPGRWWWTRSEWRCSS